ncbi:helix-turn-helix transcriptional regulator [Allobranchiibius sp. GilTou73]|uniref:ArsR/SmtB family transcription factor n=1 Tax=Allobranchiibius sp. GilTou73 TaxID=2904523 RepID=UPI001F2F5BE4|nr:metalloregulator ArsR/SmtB family transcription factor [Allobranchiibius sp. GilTou73]UIJ35283.1 metalloregulator ArsR/SmtB family transcription factor [Allobranchiibius sp. GilTou73]
MSELGDVDLSAVGAVLADPGRCRMLLALDDGRTLPASRLADEAGVSAATASSHLRRLVDAGMLVVEPHGRYRYYRLAGPEVGRLIETLQPFAPRRPVQSLRQGTRAAQLRTARTCYDHLAGRLGVALMTSMLERHHLTGGDGQRTPKEGPQGAGSEIDYELTDAGRAFLDDFRVTLAPRRRAIRYCIDWTEQQHHLGGALGRGLFDRMVALDWVRRSPAHRAVDLTPAGREGLAATFGIQAL